MHRVFSTDPVLFRPCLMSNFLASGLHVECIKCDSPHLVED